MTADLPLELLRCPECNHGNLTVSEHEGLVCNDCGALFPLAGVHPVLLRHDNALFSVDDYVRAGARVIDAGKSGWVPSPSVNLASKRVIGDLRSRLDGLGRPCIVLVVGGGRQRAWLDLLLGVGDAQLRVIYSDIDSGADVDLFCDGHDLPFHDGVVDAVVTTAVLEHVLYPERVAAEITRVLRPGGLLYSEVPFMQQVHEGAYDFTRYSLSGHRRLFNGFAEIDAGMVAGPGTALAWAIENFVLAFLHGRPARWAAKAAVRLVCFWLKYFDRLLVNKPQAMDGASCTYFFGRKILGQVPDETIIAAYVGAKHVSHL